MEGWVKAFALILPMIVFAIAESSVFVYFRNSIELQIGPNGRTSLFYMQYMQNIWIGLQITNLLFAATMVFIVRENFPETRTIFKSVTLFFVIFLSVTFWGLFI